MVKVRRGEEEERKIEETMMMNFQILKAKRVLFG
jgi:hypothetical protein